MRTKLTELLGIGVPLLNAPMAPQAGGALARAVCEAGALGMIGFDESDSPESAREQVALVRAGGFDRPFGAGLALWVAERRPDLVELALELRPALFNFSFGDPSPYVERFHAAGILVCSQVQSRHWAEVALAAGVDVVVAQGTEAGGHTGSVATLPLLQIVLEMTGKPVVAAGGIATGRGLAAALAAGAGGAWVGTRFLATPEARNSVAARERIVASDETQTVYTSVFDRIQKKPWPDEWRGRALRNDFTERWHGHEREMVATPGPAETFEAARKTGDYATAHIYAGQSVGLISGTASAGDVVRELASEAEACLRAAAAILDDSSGARS